MKESGVKKMLAPLVLVAGLVSAAPAHADVSCSSPCVVDPDNVQGEARGQSQAGSDGHQPVGSTCWQQGEGCEQNYDNSIQSSSSQSDQVGSVVDGDQDQAHHITGPNVDGGVMVQHIPGGTPQATCGGYNYPC